MIKGLHDESVEGINAAAILRSQCIFFEMLDTGNEKENVHINGGQTAVGDGTADGTSESESRIQGDT